MKRLLLILCLMCFKAEAQTAYGGLLQTNGFLGSLSVDVLTLSNAAPPQSTIVVFQSFEMNSSVSQGVITNSSNYTSFLWQSNLDSTVHRNGIYTMYCTNGLAAGANIGVGYAGVTGAFYRNYSISYVMGVSITNPMNAVVTNRTFGSPITVSITTTNTNCIIVGVSTTDGPPTSNTGSLLLASCTWMTNNPLTSFGFVFNSTSGLCTMSYFTNAPVAGTYSDSVTWFTNSPYGLMNKSEETILLALNPQSGPLTGTYYVDYVNGSDANGGSSAQPFQHCPGDSNSTAFVASAILGPGATVIFKGSTTYQGLIQITNSGTAVSPITYDGNSAGTFGSGMALIDCMSNLYHGFAAPHLITSANYININFFDIAHAKNNNSYQNQWVNTVPYSQDNASTTNLINYSGDGSGYDEGYIFVYGTNWNLTNLRLHETQQWGYRSLATGNTTNTIQCQQIGIDLYSTSNVLISNVVEWAIGRSCVQEYQASNVVTTGCNFGGDGLVPYTNQGWFAVAFEGAVWNGTISNCTIHDGWQREGDDSAQRDHAGDWIHLFGNGDGIENFGDNINVVVANCLLYNNYSFNEAYGTADIYLEQDAWGIAFYNDLIINPHHMCFWISGGVVFNVAIYNCTFMSMNPTNSAQNTVYIDQGRSVFLTNDIVMNYSANSAALPLTLVNATAASSNIVSDYNVIYNPATVSYGSVRNGGTDQSLAAWNTATGNDAHSLTASPGLSNTNIANGQNSSGGNFSLALGSEAIHAGANLSQFFTSDFAGLIRTVPWDIGAYKYQSSSPSTQAQIGSAVIGTAIIGAP